MPTGLNSPTRGLGKPCTPGCACGRHNGRQHTAGSLALMRVSAKASHRPHVAGCGCGWCTRYHLVRHGETSRAGSTPEYTAWVNMRARCLRPNHPRYADWGGRGITICERWSAVENFLADMGRRPSPAHQLDRIDNDGNYEPANCRWATRSEQQQNKRRYRVGVR